MIGSRVAIPRFSGKSRAERSDGLAAHADDAHHNTDDAHYPARSQRGRLRNFASYHMFLHVEHHLFPQVPTCHLPALARRLDAVAPELTRAMVI